MSNALSARIVFTIAVCAFSKEPQVYIYHSVCSRWLRIATVWKFAINHKISFPFFILLPSSGRLLNISISFHIWFCILSSSESIWYATALFPMHTWPSDDTPPSARPTPSMVAPMRFFTPHGFCEVLFALFPELLSAFATIWLQVKY